MPSDSVDLIYLDPPFNSNRSYNELFKDERVRSPEYTALLVCSSANTPYELAPKLTCTQPSLLLDSPPQICIISIDYPRRGRVNGRAL
jgi:hypothetical protein